MALEKVTIDGVDYYPAAPKSGEVRILVLPGRWNIVGRYHFDADLDEHVLTDSAVIRYWGTPDGGGLGLLAAHGPTTKTKLDKSGTVTAARLVTAFTIECDASKWEPVL